jgi:hypothetical protein
MVDSYASSGATEVQIHLISWAWEGWFAAVATSANKPSTEGSNHGSGHNFRLPISGRFDLLVGPSWS